jgi:hypothetical protein
MGGNQGGPISASTGVTPSAEITEGSESEDIRPYRTSRRRTVLRYIVTFLILPVALPAWLLEELLRRRGVQFQFGLLSSIPYFSVIAGSATGLVIFASGSWPWIGIILLSSMEIVGVAVAIVVGLGGRGSFPAFVSNVTRRRVSRRLPPDGFRRRASGGIGYAVVASSVALLYSAWFFACVAVVLVRFVEGQLIGVPTSIGELGVFWQCLYYSATTMVTADSTVTPVGGWAQFTALLNLAVGLIFFVFVITVVTERHASRLDG